MGCALRPDVIAVEGIEIDAEIGVYPHERGIRQALRIDLRLDTDVRHAAASDDLSETLDYDRAVAIACEVAGSGHHALIETVAEKLAARLLAELGPSLRAVWVRVGKPGAVPRARTVAVEITRSI